MPHTSHGRRSIRLPGFDYTSTAVHFVTICTHGRARVLGDVVDGQVVLSAEGRIVDEAWRAIPDRFPHVGLDDHVVMPNHVHGLIALSAGSAPPGRGAATLPSGIVPRSLGAVIGAFKSVSAKQVNALRRAHRQSFWQRNYYEHIVRDDADLQRIRHYIADNPLRWRLTAPDA